MNDEVIISEGMGSEDYRYAEVGSDGDLIRLYVEAAGADGTEGAMLRLTRDEALDLMAALGQAVRAL